MSKTKQENITKALATKKLKESLTQTYTPFNAKQLLVMAQRTPPEHIYKRPGKGGGEWDYVTGTYVKKQLNAIFGFMWDFEVKEHGREGDIVWVLGRLTVKDKNGITISKEQFGRAEVKFKNEYEPVIGKDGKQETNKWGKPATRAVKTDISLDFGNDLKGATTDALKKCASEFGIASDIYGKAEFKELELPNPDADNEIEKKKNFDIASNMIKAVKSEEVLIEIGVRISNSNAYNAEQKKLLNEMLTKKANEIENKNQMQ